MGMGTDDKIGNGNGKKYETTCIGMGMALIPMGINFHRRLVSLTILCCIENNSRVPLGIFSLICDVQLCSKIMQESVILAVVISFYAR